MLKNVVVRELETKDYKKIAEFNSNFDDDKRSFNEWLEILYFWWDNNPAYLKEFNRGALVLDSSEIVGVGFNIPTKMIWNGEEVIVSNRSTWRVLPEYRKHSMDVWFKSKNMTENYIYFNTTPSDFVIKLLNFYKYTEYKPCENWYYYFGNSICLSNSNQLKILGFLQKLYISLTKILTKLNQNTKILIKDNCSNKEFDLLWKNSKNYYLYTNVRDNKYIDWISQLNKVLYVYKESKLIGFIILKVSETKKHVILVDYWGKEILNHFKSIVSYITKTYFNYNVVLPDFCDEIKRSAKQNMFIRKSRDKKCYIKIHKNYDFDISEAKLNLLQGDFGLLK